MSLGGCGASPADQVRAEVEQLAQATAHHAYRTLCTQILAPSLVAHLTKNGISCPQAMSLALSAVHDPTVSVGKVIIRHSQASAITLSSARGQRATVVAIQLHRGPQGWRITSLGSPLTAAEGR